MNVGSGKDVSIKELALTIKSIVGYKGELVFDVTKPDGTPRRLMDVSKLSKMGWCSTIHLREGIASVYKEYSERDKL